MSEEPPRQPKKRKGNEEQTNNAAITDDIKEEAIVTVNSDRPEDRSTPQAVKSITREDILQDMWSMFEEKKQAMKGMQEGMQVMQMEITSMKKQ
ncbi:hypothetical protein TL16_g01798 [Triparma laevis f. inornata]|uniref:Uncharacterized protein n=1 Tax=Triparma laevis f. inornata TaxID=1714386 RepID=A0A9W6ZN25_9STRA|nr:hypothetical protein TL16_g01798 [Triparma laevis f. inornata]